MSDSEIGQPRGRIRRWRIAASREGDCREVLKKSRADVGLAGSFEGVAIEGLELFEACVGGFDGVEAVVCGADALGLFDAFGFGRGFGESAGGIRGTACGAFSAEGFGGVCTELFLLTVAGGEEEQGGCDENVFFHGSVGSEAQTRARKSGGTIALNEVEMHPIELVLVSGMGGAGRTTAIHTLEDLGFYCVDNLPVVLVRQFLSMVEEHAEIRRVAIGIDIRDTVFLGEAPGVLKSLVASGYRPEVLFLDAQTAVLKRRYKETRRVHPLDVNGDLSGAIERERRMLQVLDPYVSLRFDTSEFSPHALRAWIGERYAVECRPMRVGVVSFGYKHGILLDADLVFDVRFLKNPYFVPELSRLTGLEASVSDYVFSDPDAGRFVDEMDRMVSFLVPRYQREGKHYLTIGIGCTGGQHRSVALAEALYRRHADDLAWSVHHREIGRN